MNRPALLTLSAAAGVLSVGLLAVNFGSVAPQAAAQAAQAAAAPDLLASPVHQPGQTERNLYLPGGRWIDFWRALAYRPGDGALRLRRAPILKGARSISVPAPLDQLPLMVRAGAILPLLPPAVQTLSGYGSAVTVGLDDLGDSHGDIEIGDLRIFHKAGQFAGAKPAPPIQRGNGGVRCARQALAIVTGNIKIELGPLGTENAPGQGRSKQQNREERRVAC